MIRLFVNLYLQFNNLMERSKLLKWNKSIKVKL